MTELEKLIELIKPYMSGLACVYESGTCELTNCRDCRARNCANDLLASGVIVPPVEIGQTVWFISPVSYKPKITETVIEKVVWKSGGVYIKLGCNAMYETSCKSIGKTVFLSREDAEKALKERQSHD